MGSDGSDEGWRDSEPDALDPLRYEKLSNWPWLSLFCSLSWDGGWWLAKQSNLIGNLGCKY